MKNDQDLRYIVERVVSDQDEGLCHSCNNNNKIIIYLYFQNHPAIHGLRAYLNLYNTNTIGLCDACYNLFALSMDERNRFAPSDKVSFWSTMDEKNFESLLRFIGVR